MSNIESKISMQVERAGFELKVNRAEDLDTVTIDIDTEFRIEF